jgi:adenylate cyclase
MALQISAALDAAWQIAADTAMHCGSAYIEPIHLIYGLFQLAKSPGRSSVGAPTRREEIREESSQLAEIFEGLSPDFISLEHQAEGPSERRTMSRSAELKRVFEKAAEKAERKGDPNVSALNFLAELVDNGLPPEFKKTADAIRVRLERSPSAVETADLRVSQSLAADQTMFVPESGQATNRFAQLCELSWEMGAKSRLEPVLQGFCEQLLRLMPHAERCCVLLTSPSNKDELLLKAHAPCCPHRVSLTCARKAMQDRRGFVWQRTEDLSISQVSSDLQSGIYVPLVADQEVLGIICLDTSQPNVTFSSDDLYFATAVAHQLALAIVNRSLQVKLASNAEVLERLLTNFSPQVRRRLLQRAQQGKLRLGGERSEVTVLCSDIRGFTRISANMDAEDVVGMLNDYFSALTECIFRNDGSIDKFVGDAILAVFGSPDPDPQHRRKAVQAAVEMQRAMVEVNRRRSQRSETVCEIGIGVHSGEVLHGFIGSPERMEFTVIGDTVNKTARYCDGAQAGQVLISPEVHQHVWRMVEALPTSIPTKHEGDLPAYRVIGIKNGN